ncbi:MAG: hypothetical protein ACRYGK_04800 [Janthinobacterium lividum]
MKNSVDASGAVMLFVKTDEGIKLVAANSQRRKLVVQSNGACEKNESMKETGAREFFEELGNPSPTGILAKIFSNDDNCRSTVGINKLGNTLEQVAEKMVDNEGKKKGYTNASSVYMNHEPISAQALQAELTGLSEGVAAAAKFYNPTVAFLFGDKKEAFKAEQTDSIIEASALVTDFHKQFPGAIPSTFSDVFANFSQAPLDAKTVKTALEAIVDLTENDKIVAIPLAELEDKAAQFETDKETLKKTTFAPAIETFKDHVKNGVFAET